MVNQLFPEKFQRALLACLLTIGGLIVSVQAQTLREIAEAKGIYIGNIIINEHFDNYNIDGGKPIKILREEFNTTVLGNYMKMYAVLPNKPSNPYEFGTEALRKDRIDKFIRFCKTDDPNNVMRARGHTLIWHSQAPEWLKNQGPNWTKQQVYDFTYQYIKAYVTYCGTDIDEWDVLNEVIAPSHFSADQVVGGFRKYVWFRKVGNTQKDYDDYFKFCFATAREFAPHAKLFYNDFSMERYGTGSTNKNARARDFVARMHANNTEIDGVGFQSHFNISYMASGNNANTGTINSIRKTMREFGDLGYEVAITELDIRRCSGSSFGTDAGHKAAYKEYCKMALNEPNCNTFVIWGMSDKDSWITKYQAPNCSNVLIYDNSFNRKNTYFGIREALQEVTGNPIVTITGPDGYKYASDEQQTVKISDVPYDIAFGHKDSYVYLTNQKSDVTCDNVAFGSDPLPGTKKYCFIKESKVPYLGLPTSIPGVLEIENYDFGGQGVSYSDADPANKGAEESNFRTNNGVDIGAGNGSSVLGWTTDNEWVEHTVTIAQAGEYDMKVTFSSKNGGGTLGIDMDGSEMSSGISIPSTGDWNVYDDFTEKVTLPVGEHVLRFNIKKSGFNIDKLEFMSSAITNVSDFYGTSLIQIFPNPSSEGVFNLSNSTTWEVYRLNGSFVNSGEGDVVDLSSEEGSVYLLKVGASVFKLVRH